MKRKIIREVKIALGLMLITSALGWFFITVGTRHWRKDAGAVHQSQPSR